MHDKIVKYLEVVHKQKWLFIILLLIIISIAVSIRLQPLPNLVDQTSGKYISSALDPFYFERTSEHLLAGGSLNDIDTMRNLGVGGYSSELLSYSNVYIYKVVNAIYPIDFALFHIISPVMYFAFAMIVFYLLCLQLFHNRYASLIATASLSFSTLFIGRTTAGFADHEAIGVLFFLLSLYFLALFFKSGSFKWKITRKYVLFPLMVALTLFSWGGIGKILLIIYPLYFLFLTGRQVLFRKYYNLENSDDSIYLGGFAITIVSLIIISFITGLMGGLPFNLFLNSFMLSTTGIFIQFNIALYLIMKIVYILPIEKIDRFYVSFISTIVAGLIGLISMGKMQTLIAFVKSPFMRGRVGLTVAENQPISLLDLQANAGIFFTVMFIVGAVMILVSLGLAIMNMKRDKTLNISDRYVFIFTLLIASLYALNSSIRLMFINSIFLSIFVGVVMYRLYNAYKGSTDKAAKMLGLSVLTFCFIISIFSIYSFYVVSDMQTKTVGPSASPDWQNAMEWVRTNTTEDSLFIHWWDYGYWVQSLGERSTVTDGGHAVAYWDHLIGRYLLTTPNDASAFEMFNSYGVDYFLVDPSDVGKYPAFSSIGDAADERDRTAQISTFIQSPQNTQETRNLTTYVYNGQMMFDDDYVINGSILPAGKSAVVQIMLSFNNDGTFNKLDAIAVNTQGIAIPIKYRYIYFNNQLFDLGDGYPGVVRMVPTYEAQGTINPLGGALVLSERVANSFLAKTYLLGQYDDSPFLEVAYEGQRYTSDRFMLYGGRLIGPIVIYKVNDNPYGTNPGFLEKSGAYGALDEYYPAQEDL